MSDKWHGGKGDKSRISDFNNFSKNMTKIYEKKSWQFWTVWLGHKLEDVKFDSSGLKDLEQISYTEYKKRISKQ